MATKILTFFITVPQRNVGRISNIRNRRKIQECQRHWRKGDNDAGSGRPTLSPSSPTHSEDEGDDHGDQDASAEVAAALLGLSSNNLQFDDDECKDGTAL